MKFTGRLFFVFLFVNCVLSFASKKSIQKSCQSWNKLKICPWMCNQLWTNSNVGTRNSSAQRAKVVMGSHQCESNNSDAENYKRSLNFVTYLYTYEEEKPVRLLGKGVNVGGVCAGFRNADNQPVALKFVNKLNIVEWVKVNDMLMPLEVAMMFKLNNHRGIIKLLDWSETDQYIILIMETSENYVDVMKFIEIKGRLTEKQAWSIFNQTVAAVQYTHKRGVVHRDIKSSNILFDLATGQVKLIDFGSGAILNDKNYTTAAGTLTHLPPEWFNHGYYKAEPAAVWSLGVVLYTMVCGEEPFQSTRAIAQGKLQFKTCTMSSHLKNFILMLLSLEPNLRPSLEQILDFQWLKQNFQVDESQLIFTSIEYHDILNGLGLHHNRNFWNPPAMAQNRNFLNVLEDHLCFLKGLSLSPNLNYMNSLELGENRKYLDGQGLGRIRNFWNRLGFVQNRYPNGQKLEQNQNFFNSLGLGRNRKFFNTLKLGQNRNFLNGLKSDDLLSLLKEMSLARNRNFLNSLGLGRNRNFVNTLRLGGNGNFWNSLRFGRHQNLLNRINANQHQDALNKLHQTTKLLNELDELMNDLNLLDRQISLLIDLQQFQKVLNIQSQNHFFGFELDKNGNVFKKFREKRHSGSKQKDEL